MRSLTITSPGRELHGYVSLPLSKSISNRSLIISWLSGGKVTTGDLSAAEDTILLQHLIRQIDEAEDNMIYSCNAGTVYRFLAAILAITPGDWLLDGDERMCQRPVAPLVDALRVLGAQIEYTNKEGFPPLSIKGKTLEGGMVRIRADVSSQFISALLMIGPLMNKGIEILLEGEIVSEPYLRLTTNMMRIAGIKLQMLKSLIMVRPGSYRPCTFQSEADWSAAASWYSVMALAENGSLMLKGLKQNSLQGDQMLASYFKMLGVITEYQEDGVHISKQKAISREVHFDLGSTPDLAPSIIVTAAALGYKGYFTGLKTLHIKESDRIVAIADELGRNGFKCSITPDTLTFSAQELLMKYPVETYDDHRIAMAFAPLAIMGHPVIILNPGVVMKSYPGFWDEMEKFFSVKEA